MSGKTTFEGFAVVEIFGHTKAAGYVTEVEVFGTPMVKIDMPRENDIPATSHLLSPKAVFSISPVPEAHVRAALHMPEYRIEPVPVWLVDRLAPQALPVAVTAPYADDAGDVIEPDWEPVPFATALAAELNGSAGHDEPDAGDSGIVELFGAPSSAAEAVTLSH